MDLTSLTAIKMIKFLEKIKVKFKKKYNTDSKVIVEEKNIYQEYLDKYSKSFNENGYDIKIQDNKICINGNGLTIVGDSLNTFWTAEDVLCKGDYNFFSKNKYVMIDVGLNIGLTTLSMARRDNIVKIYGYEPFSSTFEQARRNLNRNPALSKKIKIFKFGLGCENKAIDINYNPELPGAMSSVKDKFENVQNIEKIEIKRASEALKDILLQKKEFIFMKIDCEGAEGEILDDLNEGNLLKKIDLIVMEWHFKSPDNLIKILNDNNFIVFDEVVVKNELGLIRAVNYKCD